MNKIKYLDYFIFFILGISLVLGIEFISVGINRSTQFLNRIGTNNGSVDYKFIEDELYDKVLNSINSDFVDKSSIDQESLRYGVLKGMVDSLGDPATVFLDPKETSEYNDRSAGNLFQGIGAELGTDENKSIIVVSPLKGSPAEKAGLKPKEVILKVDDKSLEGMTVQEAVSIIRGPAGSTVNLSVYNPSSGEFRVVSIVRDSINIPSMEVVEPSYYGDEYSSLDDSIDIIEISRFTEDSYDKWIKNWDVVVDKVKSSNANKIVIDLRRNPGGFLASAVYAADTFVADNKIILQEADREGVVKTYKAESGQKLEQGYDVIIWVDEGSASASEILAGALQLNGRAKVVGTETYGKGTVQTVIDYEDGSSLHLTIYKWLLPDGSWLSKDRKIKPDIEVSGEDKNEYLKKSLEIWGVSV